MSLHHIQNTLFEYHHDPYMYHQGKAYKMTLHSQHLCDEILHYKVHREFIRRKAVSHSILALHYKFEVLPNSILLFALHLYMDTDGQYSRFECMVAFEIDGRIHSVVERTQHQAWSPRSYISTGRHLLKWVYIHADSSTDASDFMALH